jgi:hypothetical protein
MPAGKTLRIQVTEIEYNLFICRPLEPGVYGNACTVYPLSEPLVLKKHINHNSLRRYLPLLAHPLLCYCESSAGSTEPRAVILASLLQGVSCPGRFFDVPAAGTFRFAGDADTVPTMASKTPRPALDSLSILRMEVNPPAPPDAGIGRKYPTTP